MSDVKKARVTRQGAGRQSVSACKQWGTPPHIVRPVHAFFGGPPALDPCSNTHSVVGAVRECLLPEDGLSVSWSCSTIFVNPPYGRDVERGTCIADWLERCDRAASSGAVVLALVPVATNTRHWKRHVFGRAASVCFLADTRLKFLEDGVPSGKGAPMACCIVMWGGDKEKFRACFHMLGAVVDL